MRLAVACTSARRSSSSAWPGISRPAAWKSAKATPIRRSPLATVSTALCKAVGLGGTGETECCLASSHALAVICPPLAPLHSLCRSSLFHGSRGPPRMIGITWSTCVCPAPMSAGSSGVPHHVHVQSCRCPSSTRRRSSEAPWSVARPRRAAVASLRYRSTKFWLTKLKTMGIDRFTECCERAHGTLIQAWETVFGQNRPHGRADVLVGANRAGRLRQPDAVGRSTHCLKPDTALWCASRVPTPATC
jgi:hypothetical protein